MTAPSAPLKEQVEGSMTPSNPGTLEVKTVGAGDWLKYRHPDFVASIAGWKFTRDHYTGDVSLPDKVTSYLLQRKQGEHNESFKERARNADYTNHFAAIVDGMVGMMSAVESAATRIWGPPGKDAAGKETVLGLGDPAVDGTVANRLWNNVDGQNTGYLSFWNSTAIELSLQHKVGLLVDAGEGDGVVWRLVEAECVVNWREEGGRLVEVLLEEEADTRASITSKPVKAQQYLLLTLDGWTRYEATGKGGFTVVTELTPWGVDLKDANGDPMLPFRFVTLPMRRRVGYYIARKCNAIFNRESDRDHLLRTGNHPKLVSRGTQAEYDTTVDALSKGHNVLRGDMDFKSPPTEPGTLSTEVLKGKAQELYLTAGREYGDAARQRTATEVKQDVSAGTGAFLNLLAKKLDEAETWALHVTAQLEFPNSPDYHRAARVERSEEFLPADPDAALTKNLARVFGPNVAVPLGRKGRVQAALEAAKWMGLQVEEEEVEADIALQDFLAFTARAVDFPIPALLRARAVMDYAVSAGLVDADEMVDIEGENGPDKMKLVDLLQKQAMELAQSQDESKRREAETFGAFANTLGRGGKPPIPGQKPAAGDAGDTGTGE